MQATWHSNWQFIHNLVVSPLITYPLISSCEGTLWNHKVIFLWLLQNHICPTLATNDWNSPVCWAGAGSCLEMGGDVSCSVFFSVLKFRVEPGTASPRALSPLQHPAGCWGSGMHACNETWCKDHSLCCVLCGSPYSGMSLRSDDPIRISFGALWFPLVLIKEVKCIFCSWSKDKLAFIFSCASSSLFLIFKDNNGLLLPFPCFCFGLFRWISKSLTFCISSTICLRVTFSSSWQPKTWSHSSLHFFLPCSRKSLLKQKKPQTTFLLYCFMLTCARLSSATIQC